MYVLVTPGSHRVKVMPLGRIRHHYNSMLWELYAVYALETLELLGIH